MSSTAQETERDEILRKSQEAIEFIKRSRRTDIKYLCDGQVPYDIQGTMKLPKIPPRDWVAKFMHQKQLDDSILEEYLFENVLTKFMSAMASGDEIAMRGLAEKSLVDRVMTSMPELKKAALKYSSKDSVSLDSVYVIDKLFLKGISVDRSKNDSNFDYVVVQENEKQGLKMYKHKY